MPDKRRFPAAAVLCRAPGRCRGSYAACVRAFWRLFQWTVSQRLPSILTGVSGPELSPWRYDILCVVRPLGLGSFLCCGRCARFRRPCLWWPRWSSPPPGCFCATLRSPVLGFQMSLRRPVRLTLSSVRPGSLCSLGLAGPVAFPGRFFPDLRSWSTAPLPPFAALRLRPGPLCGDLPLGSPGRFCAACTCFGAPFHCAVWLSWCPWPAFHSFTWARAPLGSAALSCSPCGPGPSGFHVPFCAFACLRCATLSALSALSCLLHRPCLARRRFLRSRRSARLVYRRGLCRLALRCALFGLCFKAPVPILRSGCPVG